MFGGAKENLKEGTFKLLKKAALIGVGIIALLIFIRCAGR